MECRHVTKKTKEKADGREPLPCLLLALLVDTGSTRGPAGLQGRGTVAGGGGQWHHLSMQDSAPSGDTKSYQILPVSHYHITSLELEEVFRSFAVTPTFLGKDPRDIPVRISLCVSRALMRGLGSDPNFCPSRNISAMATHRSKEVTLRGGSGSWLGFLVPSNRT